MNKTKRLFSTLIALVSFFSFALAPAGHAANVKLTRVQTETIAWVLDLYLAASYEYGIHVASDYDSAHRYNAYDAKKPNDELMISAAVSFLYESAGFPSSESWMKPLSVTGEGESFRESQVDQMCLTLFAAKPKSHSSSIWGHDSAKKTYSIGGDRGESVQPKIASYKTLSNGDVQVTARHRSYDSDYNEVDSGMAIVAVLRPSKSSAWGFTFRSITFKGTPRY